MNDLSLADYHRHPAWSPTALKAAVTGTMRAWWQRFGPGAPPFIPSPDMVKGDLVDALLTPPFSIEERFAAFKTIARNTKAGAANCAEAEAAGLTPVSHEMVEQAKRIRDALHADPVVGEVLAALNPAASQQPHFWDDEAGRPCRCLPDVVTSDGRLFDLKKTRSAVPRRFYWQAKDLAYDLQIAHLALGHQHRCGSEPAETGVIAFEWPSDPAAAIDCSLLIFDGQDLQTGLARREEAFQRIAD
ncbi:PD-(D/E)XK nuclease-like domain-containing protein [Synechococcus sp. CS-1331]|uniref:PD-(D/E)XK nuclease-like domain-containing protein n=1 Tax=Synechococcus sp. CS-1331 TaxID=2847973 RepID=UPI00223B097E|nr:PD-(D/E)XK nuclease-like domain-containing protein [Synechococcus sp. CS-1331]MCT0227367.1 PD-(D/E)XK nuclease-like domain-containing protein [Synechococcus sp. CS-1331]